MTNTTELLRRALESFDWMDVDNSVTDDIRAFLDAEPEADKCKHRIADARNPVVQSGYVCVDCHALFQAADHQSPKPEPARKPMTEEELRKAFLSTNTAEPLCEGWPGLERFARAIEKHHGIDGNPSEIINNQEVDKSSKPMSDEYDLVKVLNDPEGYYPGNFETPEKANAFLMCLCQEAADEIEKLKTKREWQGLTDEERDEVSKDYGPLSGGEWTLMLLVEQALKEKNGG